MSVHVDIIAELQKRSVEQAATQLERSFNNINAPIGVDVKAAEIKAAAEKIKREFDGIRAEVKVDVDKNSLGQASRAFKDVENSARSANNVIAQLGKTAFQTMRGGLAIGAPVVIDGLIQIVEQATAATQSLWLLPAAAAAAGAGIGTLAIATHGFADAIKDMGDPKKWAEDLQLLSPAAQQAALQIKNLVDGPLGQLKAATQDAFFAGMGDQINRLVTTYLPSIQNLTTSIATSFNQMMSGVGNQLVAPETQASLQTMFTNIERTFQNLAPAAAPFVKALTDIATVGSGFLPGFATAITNASNSFAAFINNARESGQLQVWIQQGIDAVKNLATASWELIQIFYRVFGPGTANDITNVNTGIESLDQTFQSYGADLTKISDIIGLLSIDTETWATKWHEEMSSMTGFTAGLRDAIYDIPEAMAAVVNGAIDMANKVNHAINTMAQNATNALSWLPGDQNYTPMPDIPHVPPGGDWRGYQGPGVSLDNPPNQPNRTSLPTRPGVATPGNPPPGPLLPVPVAPGPPGSKPSDRERLDAIRAGLDPSLYKVDPFAPVPGMPSPGTLAGGPMPGGGYGAASGQDFFEGQQKIISQAHDLEEKRKDRLALERDNQSTAEQITDAKWKEHQAEVDLQKAQADLVDKTKGTAKQAKQGINELSAALDPDLGLGKGLSGLADNLVRFLGHAALAGPMAQWQQTIDQSEAATGITGGYGLLGMRGASNLEQGLSPLLGRPMPGGAASGTTGGTSISGALSALPGAGGAYPGDAALLSHVPATGTYDNATKDLSLGLADCSSAVEDLVNIMDGRSTVGGSLTTHNAAQLLPGMGFQRGMGGPGDFRVGYNSGHMQATLPGGTPFNYGGESTIDNGGVGSLGADDPAFTDHWFRPAGASAGMAPGSAPSLGGSGGVVPVYVTNFGGMGASGAAAALPGGGLAGGAGAPAMPTGGGLSAGTAGNSLWDAVANAESGGNWAHPDNGTGHFGGLQFSPETWRSYGGTGMPQNATREQQIAIANNTAFNGYNGTPPQGLQAWEAITNGSVPGVTASTPASAFGVGGAPGPGGIPAPAGASPAVADILSRMSPISGQPPGGAPIPGSPGAPLPLGGVGPDTTRIGGLAAADSVNPGGAGFGIMPGGTLDSLIQGGLQAAGGAAGPFGGGAGGAAAAAAAQTLMKLANRAIQFGGQAAGIGVQGLMDTFLPTGGSELAQNNWLTRIAGAVGAAAPALPNIAGGALGQQQQQGPLTPEQVAANGNQHGLANGAPAGPQPINITQNNNNGITAPEKAANAIADNVRTANAAPMAGAGAPPR